MAYWNGILLRIKNRLISRLRYSSRLGPLWSRFQSLDDFIWDKYTQDYYRDDITKLDSHHTTQLSKVRWNVTKEKIITFDKTKPIHPNHLLIYETALALKTASIFEFGFGGGDHLANLRLLFPHAKIGGTDISETQYRFALERNRTELTHSRMNPVWLDVRDMTQPTGACGLENWAEFVFCQAGIMHIHGARRHKSFMSNMWRVSSRYILIVENWVRHNFVKDLRAIFPTSNLYVVSNARAVAILIDKENASEYPTVQTDKQLRDLFVLR